MRTESKERTMRLSTAAIGMAAAFATGVFAGTLLPGAFPPKAPATAQQAAQNAGGAAVSAEHAAHIRQIEKQAAERPRDAAVWKHLGDAYFDADLPGRAITAYEKSLALAPGDADVLTDLGVMYRAEKNFDKALDCFRRAQALNAGHVNALFNEGVVLCFDLDRKDEARQVWLRLLTMKPDAKLPDGRPLTKLLEELR